MSKGYLFGFEGVEGADAAHGGGVNDDFVGCV